MQKDETYLLGHIHQWVHQSTLNDAPQGGAANWDLMFWNPNRQ